MARLYGGIVGNRGEATRLGTADSGMRAFVQGWRSGVTVYANVAKDVDRDEFEIYMTGGSGNSGSTCLGRVTIADAGDGKPHFYPSNYVRKVCS